MKMRLSLLGIFCLLAISSCVTVSQKASTPTVTQPTEVVSSVPTTKPPPTLNTGNVLELTISIRDESFHSHIYAVQVGCFDTMPCIVSSKSLFNSAYPVSEMSWSPNGQSLVFQGKGDRSSDIFITSDEGKTIDNITKTQELDEGSPNWSPDSKQIAYSVRSSMESSKIMVSSPDGKDIKQILQDIFEPIQFTWSHNGLTAYSAFVSNHDGRYQIRVLNKDGSLFWLIPLDENKTDFGTADAAFSPDDKWLIYTGGWLNNDRTYLGDLQTKTVQELFSIDRTCSQLNPSWSPNGNLIAFISNCESEDHQQYDLYLISLAQRYKIKLDTGLKGYIQNVAWRPAIR